MLGLFAVIVVLAAWGCNIAPDERDTIAKGVSDTGIRIDAAREELAKREAEAAANGDKDAQARIAKTIEQLDKARELVKQGETLIKATVNADGSIDFADAGAAAMAINPLLGTGIMVGGPLLAGLIQQIRVRNRAREADQLKQTATRIVDSIEKVKDTDPAFADAFKRNKDTIATIQGKEITSFVNDIRGTA